MKTFQLKFQARNINRLPVVDKSFSMFHDVKKRNCNKSVDYLKSEVSKHTILSLEIFIKF